MGGAASDAPLVELLLAATGENAQVAATADTGDTAMVLTRTEPMVLVQMRARDGSAMTAAVATSGSAYEAPEGAELTAEKEALIREWLAAPHTPWQVLVERFED